GIRDFHVTGVQTCALPISRVRGVVNAHALATGWRLGSGQAVGRPTRYYRVAIQISSPAWNTANATRQVTVKRRPLSSRLSQVMQIGRASCRGEVENAVVTR